jgi:dienelactone hydrolase
MADILIVDQKQNTLTGNLTHTDQRASKDLSSVVDHMQDITNRSSKHFGNHRHFSLSLSYALIIHYLSSVARKKIRKKKNIFWHGFCCGTAFAFDVVVNPYAISTYVKMAAAISS